MEDQWKTALTIAAACLTMGSLTLFIIVVQINHKRKNLARNNKIKTLENEMQAFLIKNTLEVEEREKERIFRNFHDQVNPMIRFVMRRLEGHRLELDKQTLSVNSLNEDIEMLLRALDEIKACTYDLIPSYMMNVGLEKSLEDIIRKINLPGNIKTSFEKKHLDVYNLPFSQSQQLNIYRITLELINNTLQHSGCTELKLITKVKVTEFVIELRHNGKGISNLQAERYTREGEGNGLKSCKARALLLNAKIDYFFSPIEPCILLSIPYKP